MITYSLELVEGHYYIILRLGGYAYGVAISLAAYDAYRGGGVRLAVTEGLQKLANNWRKGTDGSQVIAETSVTNFLENQYDALALKMEELKKDNL